MDTRQIAQQFGTDLVAHRDKLAGRAGDAQVAQAALAAAAEAILEQRDAQRKSATTMLGHWDSAGTAGFEKSSARFAKDLKTTAAAGAEGAKIIGTVTDALTGGHTSAQRLVDEYVQKASKLLDAGLAGSGAGGHAGLIRAVGEVSDLANRYAKESAGNLRAARAELQAAAKRLRALEKVVQHDGVADPARKPTKPSGAKKEPTHTKPGGKGKNIVSAARGQLGYHEIGNNKNKYGPTAAWCSSFATWAWRKAGVKIPITPFTGNVYKWGQQHGTAYGKSELKEARPGDVLLFGTGPGSPATSTHIGIVEKVDGGKVTLIEGNSSDQVRRVTHPLSSSVFYGGVHPK
ncbi:CHAP domain-containing protein [Amycolatopsis nigrescens]|uniref:C40 family peptidase n=1 Tax=Amycolatopsis nigrescens TaxID=381445 RepID=UPI00035F247F|nr:CHAP domain-containing protein [Amycolatopsis nigrescens]